LSITAGGVKIEFPVTPVIAATLAMVAAPVVENCAAAELSVLPELARLVVFVATQGKS